MLSKGSVFSHMMIGNALRFLKIVGGHVESRVEQSWHKEVCRNAVNWGGLGFGVQKFRGVQ